MSELIITERSNPPAIADAIRNRTGIAEELTIDEMINGINSIVSSGGVDVSDATIISGSQMLAGVTAYSQNGKITGTIPSQNAKTVVPNDNSQIAIPSGTYASGDITVAAIPDEYVTTTDANAIANDIMLDKTAYINGEKVTGSFTIDAEITAQDAVIAQIQSALEGKTSNNLDTSDATATAGDIATGKTAYVNGIKITGAHECSGGTSVDTCTLQFDSSVISGIHTIKASTINDGTVESVTVNKSYGTATIQNVICGSFAMITPPPFNEFTDNVIVVDGESTYISDSYYVVFDVPYKKDGVVTVQIDVSDTQGE